MSFLPDLAGWALSGGAGRGGEDNEDTNDDAAPPVQQETEEEIRAKRLARLEARFGKSDDGTSNEGSADKSNQTSSKEEPMEIDPPSSSPVAAEVDEDTKVKSIPEKVTKPAQSEQSTASIGKTKSNTDEGPLAKKIKGKETSSNKSDPMRMIQRKKEVLLKKTLKIKLANGTVTDRELVEIDIGENSITVESVSEILASRLAISPKSLEKSPTGDKGLFAYLGACHKRVSEELKNMPAPKGPDDSVNDTLRDILHEMKRQVVSYAATSLIAPDLFESAADGPSQLAQCLTSATLDPVASITIGVAGKKTSFWTALCDELCEQDESMFESVVQDIVAVLKKELSKSESVLENSGSSGLVQVSAMTALCTYKKAAVALVQTPQFLLPPPGSAESTERVTVPIQPPPANATPQQLRIYRMMSAVTQGRQSYLKRSGPALEKETLLGLVLRLGTPMDNSDVTAQFQNVARSTRSDVQKRTESLRRQLHVYQDTAHNFVKSLITAGESTRKKVRYSKYLFHIDILFFSLISILWY